MTLVAGKFKQHGSSIWLHHHMAESLICELEKFSLWADQSAKDAYKTVTIKKKKKLLKVDKKKKKERAGHQSRTLSL